MSIEFYQIKECVFSVQIFLFRTNDVQFGNTAAKTKKHRYLILFLYKSTFYEFITNKMQRNIWKNVERETLWNGNQ